MFGGRRPQGCREPVSFGLTGLKRLVTKLILLALAPAESKRVASRARFPDIEGLFTRTGSENAAIARHLPAIPSPPQASAPRAIRRSVGGVRRSSAVKEPSPVKDRLRVLAPTAIRSGAKR